MHLILPEYVPKCLPKCIVQDNFDYYPPGLLSVILIFPSSKSDFFVGHWSVNEHESFFIYAFLFILFLYLNLVKKST